MQVSASVLDLVCRRIKFRFVNIGPHSLVVGRRWRERGRVVKNLEGSEEERREMEGSE